MLTAFHLAAAAHNVNAMPTFMFFRNRTRLAKIQGADPAALESKIRELYGSSSAGGSGGEAAGGAGADVNEGHIDLTSMVHKGNAI